MPSPDLYRILQVHPTAEPEVIQAAYRRLARKYHPDAEGGSEARMAELNAAYAVLGDPVLRADFDRRHGGSDPAFEADPRERAPTADSVPPARATRPQPVPEDVSPDQGPGRNPVGSGYDPATMGRSQEAGSAGLPPGQPWGSVLTFGRYAGWSLGEVARVDPEFLEWLDRMTIGRLYREEIDTLLRRSGRRRTAPSDPTRRGLFRRR